MGRQKPYTPKAVGPQAPPAGPPARPTCDGCRHWLEAGERTVVVARNAPQGEPRRLGLCVLGPPAINAQVTDFGPLCRYPVTAADTPACSKREPGHPPAA